MDNNNQKARLNSLELGPRLHLWPLTGKVLATVIIVMMSIGLGIAVGQVILHDIIPTFWNGNQHVVADQNEIGAISTPRGDLFADAPVKEKTVTPFYQTDEFVFALKFTHIHIFGMSAIFILMGILVLFLDLAISARIWLIVLPFIGIIIDLSSVWLKLFVHPSFFWLHIPGGLLFGTVFILDAVIMLWQMWLKPSENRQT
ncbi:MAG: hypothetical protein JSW04_06865 [Desulfobacterales bacterium]|nr:MAG: hypothetical protein JSW04_06865 [Desulfobacterales bacterium]